MVYNVSVSDVSFLETHFTERVQLYIAVTHLLPCGAVTVTPFISPAVLFVLPISYFLMFITVQTVCQFRTAGVITRFLWLSWHDIHLLIFGHIKSRRPVFVTAPRLGSYLLFHATIITHSLLYYTIFYCQVFFFGIERAAEQIISLLFHDLAHIYYFTVLL